MALTAEFASHVEDVFAGFGPVHVKRMFGGAGIFHDGAMVGLVAGDGIYLRTDDTLATEIAALGGERFGYQTRTRQVALPYWRVPEAVCEDREHFAALAMRAYAAARAVRAAKTRSIGKR